MISILFFGSFQKFSVDVLSKLKNSFSILGVITTPPSPKGRHLELVKNETHIYSEENNIPVYPLDTLEQIPQDLIQNPPDFIVVAGYGKLIPDNWLNLPEYLALNMHPSLLPDYAGRCPAEWTLLDGRTETGVTLIQMTRKFDAGPIISQASLQIDPHDNRLTLYKKLYELGTEMIINTLPQVVSGKIKPTPQNKAAKTSGYARQITREDGFLDFNEFFSSLRRKDRNLSVRFKALYGWPGIWTLDENGKRIKLVSLEPEISIQYEGKNPIRWQP